VKVEALRSISIQISDEDYKFLESVSKVLKQKPDEILARYTHLFLSISAQNVIELNENKLVV